MFPLMFEGSFEVPIPEKLAASAIEAAVIAIVARLEKSKPGKLSWDSNEIRFTGGLFRPVMNWNLLLPISSGEISIHSDGDNLLVSYKLYFIEMFVIVLLMIAVVSCTILEDGIVDAMRFGIFGWLWLFGANYLICIVRFRHALTSTLKRLS